jgi:GDP-D-mannose 3', 5'-epimerase
VDGTIRLMRSAFPGPVNIGSDEMVTINDLAEMIIDISGKRLSISHVPGPLGVRGRNSDNALIKDELGWAPTRPLKQGIASTYDWVLGEVVRRSEREHHRGRMSGVTTAQPTAL